MTVLSKINTKIQKHSRIIIFTGFIIILFILYSIFKDKHCLTIKNNLLQKLSDCNSKIQSLIESSTINKKNNYNKELEQFVLEYNKLLEYLHQTESNTLINIVDDLCNSTDIDVILKKHNIILDEIISMYPNSKQVILNSIQSLCKLKVLLLSQNEDINKLITQKEIELQNTKNEMNTSYLKSIDEINTKLKLKEEELKKVKDESAIKITKLDSKITELSDRINILNPISFKIPELEETINTLKNEKEIILKNIEEKNKEFIDLEKTIKNLKLNSKSINKKIDILKKLNTDKNQRINKLLKNAKELKNKSLIKENELQNQISILQNALNNKDTEITEYKKAIQNTQLSQAELKEKKSKQELILEELHNVAKERLNRPDIEFFHYRLIDKICDKNFIETNLDESLKPIAYTICELSEKYDKLEGKHTELRTKYNILVEERNKINNLLVEKTQQYDILNSTKNNLEETLNKLKIEYESVVKEFELNKKEFEKNKSVYESNIQNLNDKIKQNENLILRLKKLNPNDEDYSSKSKEIDRLKNEINGYKATINENNKVINDYKNTINEFTKNKASFEEEKINLENKIKDLSSNYNSELQKFERLNTKYNETKTEYSSLQSKYNIELENVTKLKKDLNDINNIYSTLLQNYNQIKSELEISKSSNVSFGSNIDDLKNELKLNVEKMKELQFNYDKTISLLNAKNKELNDLSLQMENKDNEYLVNLSKEQKINQLLNVELEEVKNNLKKITTEFTSLNEIYNALQTKYTTSETTIKKYIEDIKVIEKTNSKLVTDLNTMTANYNKLLLLNPNKENVEELKSKLENELKDIKNDFNTKVNEYNDLEVSLKDVQSKLNKLKIDNENMEKDKLLYLKKEEKYNEEINRIKKEITLLQTKITELSASNETKLNQFGLTESKLNETIRNLNNKITELTTNYNNIENERKNVQKILNEKELVIEDLEVKMKMMRNLNDEMEQSKNRTELELTNLKKEYSDLTTLMNKKVSDLNTIIDRLQSNINTLEESKNEYSNELNKLKLQNEVNSKKYNYLKETLEKDIDNICGENVPNELINVCQRIKKYQNEVVELRTKNLNEINKYKIELEEKDKIATSLNKKITDIGSQLNSYTKLLQKTLQKPNLEYFRFYTDEIQNNICNINYINTNLDEPIKSIAKTICNLTQKYDSLVEIKNSIESKFKNELEEKDKLMVKIKEIENEIKNYKNVIVKDLMNDKNVLQSDKEKIKNEYVSTVNQLQNQYNKLFNLFNKFEPENIDKLNELCNLNNKNKVEQIKKIYEITDESKLQNISKYLMNMCQLKNDVAELEDIRRKYSILVTENKKTEEMIQNIKKKSFLNEKQLEELQNDKNILIKGYSMIYDEFEDEYKGDLKEMCSSDNINIIRQKYKELNNLLSDKVVKNILSKICDAKLSLRLNLSSSLESKKQFIELCDNERNDLIQLKNKASEKLMSLRKINPEQIKNSEELINYNNLINLFEQALQLDNLVNISCSVINTILQNFKINPLFNNYDTISANLLEDYQGQVRVYIKVKPYLNKDKIWLSDINPNSVSRSICDIQSGITKNYITIDCNNIEGVHCTTNSSEYKKYSDFTNIYKPNVTNKDLYIQMKSLFEQMKSGYSIVIFGYGLSGSGKTYTLLGEGSNEGLIDYVLFDKDNDIQKVELVYAFELYSNKVPTIKLNKINDPIEAKIFNHYNSSIENDKMIENKVIKNSSELKTILNDLEDERKIQKRIKSTPNNPVSSRSHLFLVFKITFNNGISGFCTFIDTAGRESPFSLFNQLFDKEKSKNKGGLSIALSSPSIQSLDKTLTDKVVKLYKSDSKIDPKDSTSSELKTIALDTIKEGMFVNESINHLVWFFNNKAGKVIDFTTRKMIGKNYDNYKDDYIFTEPSKESKQSILNSNVKIIPILNKLSSLGNINTKSKFVMLCMLRQEIGYCEEAKKTLDFATEIKST
jgi:chromosome segregation ATPase